VATILVVDDDLALQRTLRINLRARDHTVLVAGSGHAALAAFRDGAVDLVILDLGLPDVNGLAVLRRLRVTSNVPVIVLSARQDADDKVEALDEGADDYVTKPFSMSELMARVRRALRRFSQDDGSPASLSADGLVIDFESHQASRDGVAVHMTPIEWRLLAELARHPGRVVGHDDLLRAGWGPGFERESHYLRVFVNQIRRKIEVDPAAPRHLLTEAGLGYRLVA